MSLQLGQLIKTKPKPVAVSIPMDKLMNRSSNTPVNEKLKYFKLYYLMFVIYIIYVQTFFI